MGLELSGLEVFLAVARAGSVRGAARALGITPSVASQRLRRFEQRLGVILVIRNNRSLSLTDTGRELYLSARPGVDIVNQALRDVCDDSGKRAGLLKISLPWSAYRIAIEPMLLDFRATHPTISLQFSFEEALVDIVGEGFHAGFRLGDRLADGMTATRVTPPLRAAFFASARYLDRQGTPRHPNDLVDHSCIRYKYIRANRIAAWEFIDGDQKMLPKLGTELVFDSFHGVIQASVAGLGIGWALRAVIGDQLDRNELVTVLDEFTITHPAFYIYYPGHLARYPPLRLFIDFLLKKINR